MMPLLSFELLAWYFSVAIGCQSLADCLYLVWAQGEGERAFRHQAWSADYFYKTSALAISPNAIGSALREGGENAEYLHSIFTLNLSLVILKKRKTQ